MLKTVRLIGLPTDSHSSFLRGPAQAPDAIRAALNSEHGNMATELGGEIGRDIAFEDVGDLQLEEAAGDFDRIRAAASDAAQAGATPLFIGGDHMVTYPIIAGLATGPRPAEHPPFRCAPRPL